MPASVDLLLMNLQKLPRQFYARDTLQVAQELLGALLVHRTEGVSRIAKIVEVEAYVGAHDLAAHSSKGITKRTQVMFGPPGFAYVYLIYGMHHCMNVVTEPQEHGCAVLVRALEPVQNVIGNTRGPGLLCNAMGIDRRLNAHDLESDDFFIAARNAGESFSIVRRPRIGVAYAGDWATRPLRFYIEGSKFISKK
jgi:DNA-3-methyladenine glycosylase